MQYCLSAVQQKLKNKKNGVGEVLKQGCGAPLGPFGTLLGPLEMRSGKMRYALGAVPSSTKNHAFGIGGV